MDLPQSICHIYIGLHNIHSNKEFYNNNNHNKALVPKFCGWLWILNRLIKISPCILLHHYILSKIMLSVTLINMYFFTTSTKIILGLSSTNFYDYMLLGKTVKGSTHKALCKNIKVSTLQSMYSNFLYFK